MGYFFICVRIHLYPHEILFISNLKSNKTIELYRADFAKIVGFIYIEVSSLTRV